VSNRTAPSARPRSRPSSPPWPTWSPVDLRSAYDAIDDAERVGWQATPLEDIDLAEHLAPIDYVRGLIAPERTRELTVRLATDLRMRNVWKVLASAEGLARAGKPHTLLTNRPHQSVSCSIVRQCLLCMAALQRRKPVTRQRWVRHHSKIARTVADLRRLLQEEGLTHPELRSILTLFSPAALRRLSDEAYFHLGPHAYEPREPMDLSQDFPLPTQTPEEIEAENAEWQQGVKNSSTG
jgi:hypothetical protein